MPVRSLGTGLVFIYPLVPWAGVMAASYAFGALVSRNENARRRSFLRIGLAATVAFVLLRAVNMYGDPMPRDATGSPMTWLIECLNTQKYPPSLLFLLMTLGPAIAALAWFDRASGAVARFFITIGRVPFFYYVLHIYLLHAAARAYAWIRFGTDSLEWNLILNPAPAEYRLGPWTAYVAWAAVVIVLYPLCRWFAGLKQRNRSPWLSYL